MTAYQLTPAAEADLEAIWNYTDRVWSIEQAHRYIEGLADTFSVLAETPTLARERDEFQPPVRIHPYAHHLIIYLTIDRGILVVRILHESMDVDAQLEG